VPIRSRMPWERCVCVCVHTYIHIHTYIHTYIHACMHTYIHTYIHTYREEGEDNLRPRHSRDFGDRRQSEVPTDLDNTRLGNKWVGATGKWCRVPNVPMHKLDADHRYVLLMCC
jgi:hypothetical protein